MNRRGFMALLASVATALVLVSTLGVTDSAIAQAKVPRVAYVFSFTPAQGQHLWEACRRGLRDLGYVEGRNIIVEPRWAEGHEQLTAIARDLVQQKVDVIVTAATPASLAAQAATRTIPIVIVAVADPVKSGLIATLQRPGGNITGLSLLTPELSAKRLELLSAIVPHISDLAVLMNPANRAHDIFLAETRAAANKLGMRFQPLQARARDDLQRALDAAAAARASAMIVFDDPVLWSHRSDIVALATRRRLPVMYGYREFVDEGGLISYGPDRIDLYRRTAIYVDKVLKGSNPAGLPVEQPTKFELVVNTRAAKGLGVTIPQSLMVSADKVIE